MQSWSKELGTNSFDSKQRKQEQNYYKAKPIIKQFVPWPAISRIKIWTADNEDDFVLFAVFILATISLNN